jgi:hypothetical protein
MDRDQFKEPIADVDRCLPPTWSASEDGYVFPGRDPYQVGVTLKRPAWLEVTATAENGVSGSIVLVYGKR